MTGDESMRVIIDVMGGDNAPLEMLKGALDAAGECEAEFVLVGDQDRIARVAEENGFDLSRFELVHAPSVISMEDDPITVIHKKKDSSMVVGLRKLAAGEGEAFVSAGNTGALFAGATLIAKRARGVQRAAIGTVLPGSKPCLLLDAGANVTVVAEYLEQFAIMGSAYMRKMYDLAAPTVGLLNNGTEDCKGTALQIEANGRLAANQSIRYVGNVEASAVLFGACDVLVTDGFTGNVFLKAIEGMGKYMMASLKRIFTKNILMKLSALLVKKPISLIKKDFDPAEHGGSPILGLAKPVIKAHGSSDARAFRNAIFQAIRYAESGVIPEIAEAAQQFAASKKAQAPAGEATTP